MFQDGGVAKMRRRQNGCRVRWLENTCVDLDNLMSSQNSYSLYITGAMASLRDTLITW